MSSPTRFKRTSKLSRGYDVGEVDDFFTRAKVAYELAQRATGIEAKAPAADVTPGEAPVALNLTADQVRTAAFTLRRGGYVTADVDVALDRLEDALAVLERDRLVADEGEERLVGHLLESAKVLQGRLERPEGERFARGLRGWERTYDVGQVDELCDQLWRYFNEGAEMSADEVRRATFRPRRGNLGYREPQVDAFLDRVVSVMVST